MSKRADRQQVSGALVALALLAASPAEACWDAAATRYGVSRELLYAIARTESGMNPFAIGRNVNGSHDIGLMQINSTWLPALAPHGIGEHELLEPCTNIQVGAWILAGNVQRLGYTWEAVGAYHTADPALARAYAARIYRELHTVRVPTTPSAQAGNSTGSPAAAIPVGRADHPMLATPPSAP